MFGSVLSEVVKNTHTTHTIENCLRDRSLQIASETSPRSTTVDTQRDSLALGCKAEQLPKNTLSSFMPPVDSNTIAANKKLVPLKSAS